MQEKKFTSTSINKSTVQFIEEIIKILEKSIVFQIFQYSHLLKRNTTIL